MRKWCDVLGRRVLGEENWRLLDNLRKLGNFGNVLNGFDLPGLDELRVRLGTQRLVGPVAAALVRPLDKSRRGGKDRG